MVRRKYVLTVSGLLGEKETVPKEEPIITVSKEVVSIPKSSRKKLYAGIIVAMIIGLTIGYAISTWVYGSQLVKKPYTIIEGENVIWRFTTLDGTLEEWSMPVETYVYYLNKPKPAEYHYLTTDEQSFRVRKMELFVEPEFFSKEMQACIHCLTAVYSARDFVREVFNLRKQLTVYSEDITDTPQWSGETLTIRTGDCEDFAILMGSLLMAGNEYADYGMTIQMVYMDTNNPTTPQTVNHVLLRVIYEDESMEFVDSTSTYTLSPWSRITGWYFDL